MLDRLCASRVPWCHLQMPGVDKRLQVNTGRGGTASPAGLSGEQKLRDEHASM